MTAFDFAHLVEVVCSIRVAKNQTLTRGVGEGEEDAWMSDYVVWTETAKD